MSNTSSLRVLRRTPTSQDVASGRRAVLVHGSMDRATSFTRLMARLPDWTIVTYDRRGYAGSSSMGPAAHFDEQVVDLLEVLDCEPAVAFGHSFGGDVVLAAAANYPELIPAAVVWEPPQPWLGWWPDTTARLGATPSPERRPDEQAELFMRRMIGDRVWERLPARTRAQRRAEGLALQAEIESITGTTAFDVTAVGIPVIVGRGGRSRTYQRRAARELAAALPSGELVELADAAHGAHLGHPGEVAGLIRRAGRRAAAA